MPPGGPAASWAGPSHGGRWPRLVQALRLNLKGAGATGPGPAEPWPGQLQSGPDTGGGRASEFNMKYYGLDRDGRPGSTQPGRLTVRSGFRVKL